MIIYDKPQPNGPAARLRNAVCVDCNFKPSVDRICQWSHVLLLVLDLFCALRFFGHHFHPSIEQVYNKSYLFS